MQQYVISCNDGISEGALKKDIKFSLLQATLSSIAGSSYTVR